MLCYKELIMMNWEKVIPAAIPMRRAPSIEIRDPFHCLPATYTENLYKDQSQGSKAFRDKVEADRKRLGLS